MRLTKRFLFIFTIGMFLLSQSEAIVTDPELDFINTSEDVCAECGILKTEEVIRIELDVRDDGKPTIFLTYNGTGSKTGGHWTAYSPAPGGYARANGVDFREDFVRAGKVDKLNPNGGLLVLYIGKGGGNLVRYKINGVHVFSEDIQILDYSIPEHQLLFEKIFGRKHNERMPDEFYKKAHNHQIIAVKDIEARATSASNNNVLDKGSENLTPPDLKQVNAYRNTKAESISTTRNRKPNSTTQWLISAAIILTTLLLVWRMKKS